MSFLKSYLFLSSGKFSLSICLRVSSYLSKFNIEQFILRGLTITKKHILVGRGVHQCQQTDLGYISARDTLKQPLEKEQNQYNIEFTLLLEVYILDGYNTGKIKIIIMIIEK